MTTITETHPHFLAERNGYRALVVPDMDPVEPWGDAQAAVIELYPAYARTDNAGPYVDRIQRLVDEHGHDVGVIERYLRIFHGTRRFYQLSTRDAEYLIFDSAAMREKWGCPDQYADQSAKGTYEEWRSYLDGDCYGVVIERLETHHTTRYFNGETVGDTTTLGWEDVEAVWGYYGLEYAEESAREQLDTYASRL